MYTKRPATVPAAFLSLRVRSRVVLALIVFEKDGIEKDGRANKKSLLVRSGIRGKSDFKCVSIRKGSSHSTLFLLQNLANIWSIAVGILLVVRVNMKGFLAASSSTARITLGTRVDAHATTASRLMHGVDGLILSIEQGKGRHTAVTLFLQTSHFLTTTRDGRLLVAAALARTSTTSARTFHRQHFRIRIEFLDLHSEWMTR